LKDKGFWAFLEQNPPFELLREMGFCSLQIPVRWPGIDNNALKITIAD
jgi:hypothetical protein